MENIEVLYTSDVYRIWRTPFTYTFPFFVCGGIIGHFQIFFRNLQ